MSDCQNRDSGRGSCSSKNLGKESINCETLDHGPMVSVYMPTHNREHLLKRAVESVLAQTYQNFELIIVDDGSRDGSPDYLQSLASSEPRVRFFCQPIAQGACAARNIAIKEAKGKYITGLDDDDEFLPNRLEQLLSSYDEKYAFVCQGTFWHYGSHKKALDANAMIINLSQMLDYNYSTNQVLTETKRLQSIGGFNPEFPACQDYDTWTRLILKYGAAKRIAGASYIIHQGHEGPRIISKSNMQRGYKKFSEEYGSLMSKGNRINQKYLALVSSRKRFKLLDFFQSVRYGLVVKKCRYLLSSNLKLLSKLRSKWLRG
ncbi:Glycosyltransferase involved in cell wall biogenesis-like protein [Shewanella sediminis HAW-EB3]|uniref:Glycosyltransferase involved in cell wall biogenesis-like protein n=1 Tax=Shewanella sediminis (strain HAW-EB3) TaxID=425104 RepID=A8FXL4_SHESH|nr:glycosyltransferase [Shewanella sediminis]ABV37587.1 Glycosyltransferase involved in cell wall biogenesis-like protein [Shewanella sediminis HAW-EB3]